MTPSNPLSPVSALLLEKKKQEPKRGRLKKRKEREQKETSFPLLSLRPLTSPTSPSPSHFFPYHKLKTWDHFSFLPSCLLPCYFWPSFFFVGSGREKRRKEEGVRLSLLSLRALLSPACLPVQEEEEEEEEAAITKETESFSVKGKREVE